MQPLAKGQAARVRRLASLRLALGQAQMAGSIITAVLLIQNGVSPPVIWATALTALLSLVSVVLFQIVWKEDAK